jgi:hypothetical protein
MEIPMTTRTWKYEPAEDASVDPSHVLIENGKPSRFSIQVCATYGSKGCYWVVEENEDEDSAKWWIKHHAEFSSLSKAKAHAITLANSFEAAQQ